MHVQYEMIQYVNLYIITEIYTSTLSSPEH